MDLQFQSRFDVTKKILNDLRYKVMRDSCELSKLENKLDDMN